MNRNRFHRFGSKIALGATAAMASGMALAGSTLSSQFVTEVTGQKAELYIVAGLVLLVSGIVFMTKSGKRTAS